MLGIKLLSVAAFLLGWLSSKRSATAIKISDAFCFAFLVIFLPYFFFNTGALSSWHDLTFADAVIEKGQCAIIWALMVGALIFFVRGRIGSALHRVRR